MKEDALMNPLERAIHILEVALNDITAALDEEDISSALAVVDTLENQLDPVGNVVIQLENRVMSLSRIPVELREMLDDGRIDDAALLMEDLAAAVENKDLKAPKA